MLTPDELAALQAVLDRANRADSQARGAALAAIAPGDVVQIRPGIDRTWETSLVLVMETDARQVKGQLLRPHRSGCRDAWARLKPGEVLRVGRAPFPEPAPDIRAWTYCPPCPIQQRKQPATEGAPPATPRQALAVYRDHQAAHAAQLGVDKVRAGELASELNAAQRALRKARRAHGRRLRTKGQP